MGSGSGPKQEFAITIDGTQITTFSEKGHLDVKITGKDHPGRGHSLYKLIGLTFEKAGFDIRLQESPDKETNYTMRFKLVESDSDNPIAPKIAAEEILPTLQQLKAMAEQRNKTTGIKIGFIPAMHQLLQDMQIARVEHTPPNPTTDLAAHDTNILSVEKLRIAIQLGLTDAHVDKHLTGGMAQLQTISDTIMAKIAVNKTNEADSAGSIAGAMILYDHELRAAIQDGLDTGLQAANANDTEALRADAIEAIHTQITLAINATRTQPPPYYNTTKRVTDSSPEETPLFTMTIDGTTIATSMNKDGLLLLRFNGEDNAKRRETFGPLLKRFLKYQGHDVDIDRLAIVEPKTPETACPAIACAFFSPEDGKKSAPINPQFAAGDIKELLEKLQESTARKSTPFRDGMKGFENAVFKYTVKFPDRYRRPVSSTSEIAKRSISRLPYKNLSEALDRAITEFKRIRAFPPSGY